MAEARELDREAGANVQYVTGMRDNWLSNRVFQSYDDLLDHWCEHIMTIGLRDWAHRF